MFVMRSPTAIVRIVSARMALRRQLVSGCCVSSGGTGSPRAVKYSAISVASERGVLGVGRHGAQRGFRRGHALLFFAGQTDPALPLGRVLAVDLLEAPFVDVPRESVELDLAALQRDHARSVPAREREEVQRTDHRDLVGLVDLFEV